MRTTQILDAATALRAAASFITGVQPRQWIVPRESSRDLFFTDHRSSIRHLACARDARAVRRYARRIDDRAGKDFPPRHAIFWRVVERLRSVC